MRHAASVCYCTGLQSSCLPVCLCAEGKTKVFVFAVTLFRWDHALCTPWNPPSHAWLKLNLFCSDVKQMGVLGEN